MPPEFLPQWLLKRPFAIEHTPDTPIRFLVRLPGPSGVMDRKPYNSTEDRTKDVLGFGMTLMEAAENAQMLAKRRWARSGSTEVIPPPPKL